MIAYFSDFVCMFVIEKRMLWIGCTNFFFGYCLKSLLILQLQNDNNNGGKKPQRCKSHESYCDAVKQCEQDTYTMSYSIECMNWRWCVLVFRDVYRIAWCIVLQLLVFICMCFIFRCFFLTNVYLQSIHRLFPRNLICTFNTI